MASTTDSSKPANDKFLDLDPRYLCIAILPVVVFGFGEFLISHYGDYSISIPAGTFDYIREASGRYVVYGVFLLFAVIAASVTAITGFDINSEFTPNTRSDLFDLVKILAIVVLVALLLIPGPKTYWLAGQELFDGMFNRAAVSSCTFEGLPWQNGFRAIRCLPGSMKSVFIWLLLSANFLTAVGAAFAIAGTISCLGTYAEAKKKKSKNGHEVWTNTLFNKQAARLRRYLYLSSALMVSGILLIIAWLHWPDFYVAPESAAKYQTLVSSLTLYYGFNYSLIIFSFYVPVALILSDKAAALAPVQTAAQDDNASSTFGSLPDTFRTVLALLSPFMTAVLGSVPNFLTGSN